MVVLSVVVLIAIMPSVISLSVIMVSVALPSVTVLSVFSRGSFIMRCFILLSSVKLKKRHFRRENEVVKRRESKHLGASLFKADFIALAPKGVEQIQGHGTRVNQA